MRLEWSETEVGGLHEERFGRSGRGGENESEGWRGGVEMGGGDGSEMGLVMKKKGKQKLMTSISVCLTPDYRDKEESNNYEPLAIIAV